MSSTRSLLNPLTPTVTIWVVGTVAIKHPVPDRVKPSFLIFDIRALWRSDAQPRASKCPDAKSYKWRLNPVWHRMLYSCTHMVTVGVKWLNMHPALWQWLGVCNIPYSTGPVIHDVFAFVC